MPGVGAYTGRSDSTGAHMKKLDWKWRVIFLDENSMLQTTWVRAAGISSALEITAGWQGADKRIIVAVMNEAYAEEQEKWGTG